MIERSVTWTTVVFLQKETLPDQRPFYCPNCRRLIGKFNRTIMAIMPSENGVPTKELAPGMTAFEHKCRGCEATYKILFQ